MQHFNKILKALFVVIFLLSFNYSEAQKENKAALEKDKNRLEKEIKLTNKLLKNTRKDKKSSLNELILINRKIEQRQLLIKTLEAQLHYLDFSINYNNGQVKILEKKLDQQKIEYSDLLYNAFKNRNSYSRLSFVFSSENFNQAYQRLKYLQQYSKHRKSQYDLILYLQDSILLKNTEMQTQLQKKTNLKSKKVSENTQLGSERSNKNRTIRALSKTEKNLKSKLRKKEKAAKELKSAIRKIIQAEMAKNNPKNKKGYSLTPDQLKLSNNFANNRGKLPWPTNTGIISSTFGEHKHPVLKYVTTKNDGIDIQTSKGSEVRAVFEGTVTFAGAIPAYNNAVFIRHGEYITAYSRLDKVYVKVGDKISTKEVIGTIFHDPNDNKTELHFEVWKGFNPQNPARWIAK